MLIAREGILISWFRARNSVVNRGKKGDQSHSAGSPEEEGRRSRDEKKVDAPSSIQEGYSTRGVFRKSERPTKRKGGGSFYQYFF